MLAGAESLKEASPLGVLAVIQLPVFPGTNQDQIGFGFAEQGLGFGKIAGRENSITAAKSGLVPMVLDGGDRELYYSQDTEGRSRKRAKARQRSE